MARGIRLVYDSAYADSRDTGNRSMRAGGRTLWNDDDWNAATDRLNRLAVVFYYANVPGAFGPVQLDQAAFALQQTKGMSIVND